MFHNTLLVVTNLTLP